MKVLKNENNLCEKHNNKRRNTQKQHAVYVQITKVYRKMKKIFA